MTSESERLALQAEVRSAFAGVVRPAEDLIALHQCPECDALRAAFAHESWDAMSDDLIERNELALPLLSPDAFAYFLPAYLLYSLDHLSCTAGVTEMTVYAVSPSAGANANLENWTQERIAPFTDQQARVIDRFLELAERDEELGSYMSDIAERRVRFKELRAKCNSS